MYMKNINPEPGVEKVEKKKLFSRIPFEIPLVVSIVALQV